MHLRLWEGLAEQMPFPEARKSSSGSYTRKQLGIMKRKYHQLNRLSDWCALGSGTKCVRVRPHAYLYLAGSSLFPS